jgi:hypothetical protein
MVQQATLRYQAILHYISKFRLLRPRDNETNYLFSDTKRA